LTFVEFDRFLFIQFRFGFQTLVIEDLDRVSLHLDQVFLRQIAQGSVEHITRSEATKQQIFLCCAALILMLIAAYAPCDPGSTVKGVSYNPEQIQ